MPSGVTGDDIPKISGAMEPCDVMSALLESVEKLTMLVESLYGEEGLPTIVHAREIGAITFPQGFLASFHVPEGTSLAEATRTIETIWLTEEEIDSYDSRDPAVHASVRPFWVIANAENAQGGPDVSGRFLLAADFGLEEDSPSGLTGIAPPGGDKEITLSVEELPEHAHELGDEVMTRWAHSRVAGGGNAALENSPFPLVPNIDDDTHKNNVIGGETDPVGGGKPHSNMPPYFVVIVAYRTGRMS